MKLKKLLKEVNGESNITFSPKQLVKLTDKEFGTIKNCRYVGLYNKNGGKYWKFTDIKTGKSFNLNGIEINNYNITK